MATPFCFFCVTSQHSYCLFPQRSIVSLSSFAFRVFLNFTFGTPFTRCSHSAHVVCFINFPFTKLTYEYAFPFDFVFDLVFFAMRSFSSPICGVRSMEYSRRLPLKKFTFSLSAHLVAISSARSLPAIPLCPG